MYTYEDVIPSLIPNTTMQKRINSAGVHTTYVIAPIDGYVLHDQRRDWTATDPEDSSGTLKLGYTGGSATCAAAYDFSTIIVTDHNGVAHTAYGERQFFAVPESDVPADQVFGVGTNHEVM